MIKKKLRKFRSLVMEFGILIRLRTLLSFFLDFKLEGIWHRLTELSRAGDAISSKKCRTMTRPAELNCSPPSV
jgi:hypothetical protein